MTLHRSCLLALLLAALSLSGASADTGVFVRFQLLEPAETSYYLQIGGYVHVEPWTLPGAVWPAGADSERSKRVGSGVFTDWFDLGKYAGSKLHGQLHRAGGCRGASKHHGRLRHRYGQPHPEGGDRAGHGARRARGGQAVRPIVHRQLDQLPGVATPVRGQGQSGDRFRDDRSSPRLGARGKWGHARVSQPAHRPDIILESPSAQS